MAVAELSPTISFADETSTDTVRFYGASDDLIEVEGRIPGCNEYDGEVATFSVAGLHVRVQFMANGCWSVTVWQVDESVPVTATNVELRRGEDGYPDYSMVLSMRVPKGSHVARLA